MRPVPACSALFAASLAAGFLVTTLAEGGGPTADTPVAPAVPGQPDVPPDAEAGAAGSRGQSLARPNGRPLGGEAVAGHEGHHAGGDMGEEMRAMNERMVEHLGHNDAEYEKRFIDMMIPHHQGAVDMARHALKHANRPELKAAAEKIIKDQEKEIAQMKRWREEWYGAKE